MPDQNGTPRRSFFVAAINGLGAIIGTAIGGIAAVYLLFPPRAKKGETWTPVGDLGRIPANTPSELVFQKTRVDGWKVTREKATAWVIKKSESDVIAYAPHCTHLGCEIGRAHV